MEIRLRPLVVAVIVLALVGALGYFAWPRLLPLATQLRLGPAATATVAAPVAVPTGGPEITFLDESLGWDWDATCAPQLRQFLAEKLPGRRISSLQVILVDYTLDSELPFGVRYPDDAGAQADANCYDMAQMAPTPARSVWNAGSRAPTWTWPRPWPCPTPCWTCSWRAALTRTQSARPGAGAPSSPLLHPSRIPRTNGKAVVCASHAPRDPTSFPPGRSWASAPWHWRSSSSPSRVAIAPAPAACEGLCQCWYCPRYHWIDGNAVCDSSCDHGCVGSCTGDNSCDQEAGQGGCGPVCRCRDSDCSAKPEPTKEPPKVTVTPEPTPPPECPQPDEVREWTTLIPPKVNLAGYKPDHPVVVEQDPDKQGFSLHITGAGGRYEHKTQRLEKVCDDQPDPMNGTPQPCRAWHYECPIRCAECYDDPFDAIQVRMRLDDSSLAWILGDLAARYSGAKPKEGLPKVWQLRGVQRQMSVDQWWVYAPGKPDVLSNGPLDPGVHGGKIVGWTTGTPKSPPQLVERPFGVPVFLLDTTIAK